jgi:tryptophan 7-halogenase
MKQIIILGGGLTGWTIASFLRKQFPKKLASICVVEDYRHDRYGAEAAHPAIHKFHELIGLDEKACLQNTQACFGLGLRYQAWSRADQMFFLTSGQYGASLRGVPFSHVYVKAKAAGEVDGFDSYSLNAVAARNNKFGHPPPGSHAIYAQIYYGLHLQEDEYCATLKHRALEAGVEVIAANCVAVNVNEAKAIKSIQLDNGALIGGDLFFDCTGLARVLLSEMPGSGIHQNRLNGLFNRCAWGFRDTEVAIAPVANITIAAKGYLKIIPLNGREMIQYYFSSVHMTDIDVVAMMENWNVTAPQFTRAEFYESDASWIKNCIAMGGAACAFPETYISAQQFVRDSIVRFTDLFISFELMESTAKEYSRLSRAEFNQISQLTELTFYIARHRLAGVENYFDREGLSAEAAHRLALFSSTGKHPQNEAIILSDSDWAVLFLGNNIIPVSYDMVLDSISDDEIMSFIGKLATAYQRAVAPMPMHQNYITKLKKH